jgi:hypothetical protein
MGWLLLIRLLALVLGAFGFVVIHPVAVTASEAP